MRRRLIRALLAALLLLTYCVMSPALELRQASLTLPGQSTETPIALPDTRALPPLDGARSHSAIYRLQFDLPSQPTELWALRIDRLASVHQLFLNGRLIQEQGTGIDEHTRLRSLPAYMTIAPSLLQPGVNELRLELGFGTRGGLSTVQIGPDDDLLPAWTRDRWLDTALPQGLNMAGAALGCAMLGLWWRRRQERATGLFGLLWLIASLRNHDYFVAVSPLSAALSEWLYFCAQTSTVSLLGLFAMTLSGKTWPRLWRLYLAGLLLLPPLGLAAQAGGVMTELRLFVYPLLMVLTVGTARILWPALQRQRGVALGLLVSGTLLLVAAGAHDYAYLHGWVPISDFYWTPFSLPFVLACYGAMLLDRLVLALKGAEELSHELELRVAQRTAELAEANAAKSRFLAIASHDLRQPVTAIGLLLNLAIEQLRPGNALVVSMLGKASQAVAGLEGLLRGLLDVSRLDAAPAPAGLQRVPLQPIFDAIALHEHATAHSRGLRLRFRPTTAIALSERLLLEQMLRNLVANALRYTEAGGVLVAVRRRGAGLRLQVWDSGQGIAEAHQQQIFEDFVQLEGAAQSNAGVGLGLAIVRRSAQSMGHALGLHSRVGRGSCFWIDLPAA